MLTKRIIPCLDVKNGYVVKGIKFKNHEIVGSILDLASKYNEEGADELVFYDIGASTYDGIVSKEWVKQIAELINIPFCVAGGIKTELDAQRILEFGADKVSINSPALADPSLINRLAEKFGTQCIVIGIDSYFDQETGQHQVKQFTGNEHATITTKWNTFDWIKEVQSRGAGEVVLNVMNQDGVRCGYDIDQLSQAREICTIPLIASGGAGEMVHFADVFNQADVDGALAASVFHKQIINIGELKSYLQTQKVAIRL